MDTKRAKNIVLVVDGGGRGAVLVDAYSRSPQVKKVIAVPGNDLMALNTAKPVQIYPEIKVTDIHSILQICHKEKVTLVDVAQDNAIAVGLVDALRAVGVAVVGPTQAAGQIEWDKAWAREFMLRHDLPVPEYKICHSPAEGMKFLETQKTEAWFVKAAGLAEGKGVIPAPTKQDATAAIEQMARFGKSGETFLLESWLVGEEFSAFAICDGQSFQIVGYAQDHKRALNFEMGENTGGMGAVSRPLIVTAKIDKQVQQIFQKTLAGLRAEDRPYTGILYLGGMVVAGQVFIIEFNARWGDPEVQVIVPSLRTDFFRISQAVVEKKVVKLKLNQDQKTRVVIAGTAKGYPADYSAVKGKQIYGLDQLKKIPGITVYGAGVKKVGKTYVANGGRMFYIVAAAADLIQARQKAYQAMAGIHVAGNNLHYRTDIGWRDVEKVHEK